MSLPRVDRARRRLLLGASGAAGAWLLGGATTTALAQALSPNATAAAVGVELNGKIVAWVRRVEGGEFNRLIVDDGGDLASPYAFDVQKALDPTEPPALHLGLYGQSVALYSWITTALQSGTGVGPDLVLVVADATGLELQRVLLPAPMLTAFGLEPIDVASSEPVRVRIELRTRPRYRPGSGRAIASFALVEQPLQSNARLLVGGLASSSIVEIGAIRLQGTPPPTQQTGVFREPQRITWHAPLIDLGVAAPGMAGFHAWSEQLTSGQPTPLAAQLQLLSADRRRLLGSVDLPALQVAGVSPPFPGGAVPGSAPLRARFRLHPLQPPVFNLSGMLTPA